MDVIQSVIQDACQKLFDVEIGAELTRPDGQFGDFATNVALKLAGQLGTSPREIADRIASHIKEQGSHIKAVTVAGPGFINITVSDELLWNLAESKPANTLASKTIVAEYSDPNPFKVLHAGHVYTTVVGDAIARLLEAAGGNVHRVNYGGDVGLHVGKTMWAILKEIGGENPEQLASLSGEKRSSWLSTKYVEGNNAYEQSEATKNEVVTLNKRVYEIHAKGDHQSNLAQIYWTCREWSYESFDAFYRRLGTYMEKYYPESEVVELGLNSVREQTGIVFEESDGAVIFRGEKFGLHTRVFINSAGLPTYEAKEIGLILKKKQDYDFDISVVITGNEQQEYMAVMLKAIEQFLPDLAKASRYVPHGMVKLSGGVKMSSRKGNIIPADEVLNVTAAANKKVHGKEDENAVLAAVKYSFLKNRIGGDIIYDPEESVSLEGNSGPYLQYAHARARSILSKSQQNQESQIKDQELETGERTLLRKVGEYAEVVDRAVTELMPHHICTYLYELAQVFNSFYEHNRVIGDPREEIRIVLIRAYADALRSGLDLLNIPAPNKM